MVTASLNPSSPLSSRRENVGMYTGLAGLLVDCYPETFLSIIEDVFPLVTSSAKTADVTKEKAKISFATSAVFALDVTRGNTSSMIERNVSG